MKPTRHFPSIERLEDRIAPANFLVTSLFDNTNPGSLRVAIAEANAKPGPDTITFQADLTGSINLALGRLEITDVVKITGLGADKLAIDGGVFNAGALLASDNKITGNFAALNPESAGL